MKSFFYKIWLKFVKFLADLPWVSKEDKEIVYDYYKLDNRISGLGFILFPEKLELNYLYEVGNSVGLRIRLFLIKDRPLKDKSFYLESAEKIKNEDLFIICGVKPEETKLITWTEFCKKGYDKVKAETILSFKV